MKFVYLVYRDNKDAMTMQTVHRVHQAPIEHPIADWLMKNLQLSSVEDEVEYLRFPQDKVKSFYKILCDAHAEKSNDPARPWKYLPIPDEEDYPYPIAQYEKEYGAIYYESLYKYVNVLEVILNIFDFEQNELFVCIR